MLSDRETDERRGLQKAAYAPGGGLSGTDAARLTELEAKRVSAGDPIAEQRSIAEHPPPAETAVLAESDERTGVTDDPSAAGTVIRAMTKRHWIPYIAAISALVVGAGIGWLASDLSHAPASIAVTPEQRARGESLPGEGYDVGSIRPLAERAGVIAWYHTADAGERTCLILDDGEDETTTCAFTEIVRSEPLFGAHQSPVDDEAIGYTYGTLIFTLDDRPAVQLDGYESRAAVDDQFSSEVERSIAERLVDDEFLLDSLMVVGYRDEVPVWTGSRKPDEYCLIYAPTGGAPKAECIDPRETEQDMILEVSEGEGDSLGLVVFELIRPLEDVSPYLVITEQPLNTTVIEWSDGQIIDVDDKTGDFGDE